MLAARVGRVVEGESEEDFQYQLRRRDICFHFHTKMLREMTQCFNVCLNTTPLSVTMPF
jgi:hypothetical protein